MGKGRVSGTVAACVAAAIAFTVGNASASKGAWEEYDQLIRSSEAVAALGPTLFGDQSNLQNGGLSFSVTDVSVKGNNSLPVAVTRTFKTKTAGGAMRGTLPGSNRMDGAMGDWEIDLPFVGGVFAQSIGWVNQAPAKAAQRCSVAYSWEATPRSLTVGTTAFDGHNYWHGTRINIPGSGSQAMLVVNASSPRPTGSNAYWTTSAFISVACLPSVQNATGEGFIATTADGTRYWFDWMAMAYEQELTQQRQNGYDHLPRGAFGLYATRVEDRFGNWVTYSYSNAANAPVRLSQINSSDGRLISVSHNAAGFVQSVVANGRTWSYGYSLGTSGALTSVVLPDSSSWSINLPGFQNMVIRYYQGEPGEQWRGCGNPGDVAPQTRVGTVTHPSGAVGEFTLEIQRFVRNGVTYAQNCAIGDSTDPNDTNDDTEWYPTAWDSYALMSKKVTGPGLAPASWSYVYSQGDSTEVFGPGDYARYTYGNTFRQDEGKLLRVDRGSSAAQILNTTAYTYELAQSGMPYPTPIGVSPQIRSDDFGDEYLRPEKQRAITQQGATFNSTVSAGAFDGFARPLTVTKSSTLGHSKIDTTQYTNNLSKWVLGQVEKTTTDGIVTSETYYDPTTALPVWSKAFGKLQQTFGYYADGTLATVKDGRNNTTTLSNWKRGIPQTISYAGGTTESAAVNDSGWITSVTDENGAGYTTNYTYDAMGRLASIAYPTGDSTVWATTTLSFQLIAADEYGLPAGHWKQTVSTGNARKNTYFDAMWRPVVEESFDAANSAATLSQTVKRYDLAGHLAYQSYPMRGLTGYTVPTQGARTFYDALDRVELVEQDSELGVLPTTTVYQAGFQTLTTNPRGAQTTASYKAFDQPSTDWPVAITHPEGAYTNIVRDAFGKPKSLTRRDVASSLTLSRYFVYDANQQLCKTVEPETGSTTMDYDAAGNVLWSASGLTYLSISDCQTASVPAGVKVTRSYDTRNRLSALNFPDGNGAQSWSYTPDGLPSQVTTLNDEGTTSAINTFTYNKRRLPTGETLQQPGLYTWSIGYGYDANGHVASHIAPGLTVAYAPNALGQPTQAGTYATGVSYFPNGAMSQFTYGNGIVHTLAQNSRGLPERSRDANGATAIHDDSYDFDANGNVLAISDGVLGNRGNRDMAYDGLDRLTSTTSPMFSAATYSYDVLDNLKTVKVAGRDHTYVYDPSGRLSNVTNTVGGASVIGLAYDAQGNVANKNGQQYRFDFGNRLREATGKEKYRYDAQGRRIQASHDSLDNIFSLYGQDGVLRYQEDYRTRKVSNYVYLNGSLVARLTNPANLTTAPVLSAPTNSANGAYSVNWSTVSGANRYRLEESINNGAWSQVADTVAVSWNTSGKANGNYRYRARSCFLGCSAYSAIATTTVALVPASAPIISAPTSSTDGNYTVNWGSVSLATRYELHEQVGGGAWVEILNASATSKALSGKATGSYGYRVRACNNAGCSIWSGTATVSVTLPPGGPSSFTVPAQGLNGAYTVSWGPASGATSYILEESPNGGAWVVAYTGLAQSQAFSGRAAGTYGYRVKACNASGCSAVTGTGTVTVLYPPATAPSPSAPSQGLNGAYTVSWTAVSGATSYQLDQSANGGAWTLIYNAAGTSTGFSAKAAGNYSYRARACNAAGCGPTSGTVAVAVIYPPATAPSPSVPGQSSNGSYTVSWTAVGGATSYQMDESANGGAWMLLYNAGGMSMALSGKAAGSYAYRARACNAAGCGPTSGSASVVVTYPPSTAPSPTTPAQNFTGAYTASWTAVGTATSYQLEESTNGGAWALVYNAGGWSAALAGKAAGSYAYRVKACNVGGCGPISGSVTTQVVFAPTAAPTVTTPANVATSSYTVSWNAVATATSYQVWERVNGGAWTQIVDANLISKAMSGKVNATYGYQARGCNVAGCGPWSGIASTVVNVPPPIPAMPSGIYGDREAVEGGPPSFTFYVYWFASSGATNYELQDITSTPTIVDYGSDLSYQVNGIGHKTYQVRACNVSGCSGWQGPLVL